MKSIFRFGVIFCLLVLILGYWLVFGNGTAFTEKNQYLMVTEETVANYGISTAIKEPSLLKFPMVLGWLISLNGGDKKIKLGKYEIKNGQSLWSISRMLKNGRQAEINLVINRIRLKEDLAKLIGSKFESDSLKVMHYLQSTDSLKKWGVDTSNIFTIILPNTYTYYWNSSIDKIFQKLFDANQKFWNEQDRLNKATALGFSTEQVYILASIVDEETNYDTDKSKIASVYINRLQQQMPLQACPTIKYAMKDFSLTRIYEKYLSNPSPYNTYRKKGLPPGPICTPSKKTIDLVLNAPKTDYLFFVAKSDFSGYHHFSSNYKEHDSFAKEYQKALNLYTAEKQAKKN